MLRHMNFLHCIPMILDNAFYASDQPEITLISRQWGHSIYKKHTAPLSDISRVPLLEKITTWIVKGHLKLLL